MALRGLGSLLGGLGKVLSCANPSPGHPLTPQLSSSSSSGVTVEVEPSPEVLEGTTATMTCSGIPWVGEEANYTWYKNGRWLQDGLAGSLVLARVSSGDIGSYCCQASGTRGSVTSAPLSLSVLCECLPAPQGRATGQDGVHQAQHHMHVPSCCGKEAFLTFFLLSLPCSSCFGPGKEDTVVLSSSGLHPIPESAQDQVGRGLEHPNLVEGAPVHGRGVDWMIPEAPSSPNHSMILLSKFRFGAKVLCARGTLQLWGK